MTIQDQIWLLAHSKEPEDRREWAVLYWKSQGLTHREIADKLGYGKRLGATLRDQCLQTIRRSQRC